MVTYSASNQVKLKSALKSSENRKKVGRKKKFEVTRHTALLRKLKSETHCRLASKKGIFGKWMVYEKSQRVKQNPAVGVT